ncbi:hypothetical protein V9T40_009248 [Parthenolecanium corni]|uniref:SLC26A/SulP transporter domain-containing protein n=1 Tax=Parthenolecanium corni TaxID=536013 RepID=A0AAN9TN71_9HEMI
MYAASDLIAGLTLGLTIVPQSIAYASLARLPSENGLYSAFTGGFLYMLFGTIPQVSIGPTSLMSLLTLQYIGSLPDENKIQYLCLLTFLCGVVELLMGLLHLGFLTEIISTPVISGFTSASAVIIIESQIRHILGITIHSHGITDGVIELFNRIDHIKLGDTLLGVICIALLLTLRQLKNISCGKKVLKQFGWFISVSRNAIIVLLCCLTAYYYDKSGSTVPFKLTANVISGIPAPKFPTFHIDEGNTTQTSFETIKKLGNGFITIPIVAVLINVSIAKAFATAGTIDATQEMLTLSLCNMFASCFSAMPICGAFTRSAVSNASGVKTPFSNFYSALITIFALTFLTPWFRYIPKATLAAVLIAAVIFLIDVQILKPLWKSCRRDFFILVATFFLCLYFGVEIGLLIGAAGNLIYLLYLWARPRITREKCKNEYGEYLVITPDIGLFYLGTDYLYTYLAKIARQNRTKLPIAVNCCYFKSMDYTAIKGLSMISQDYKNDNQHLVFYNVCDFILNVYKNSDCKNIQFCGVNENLNEYLFSTEIDFRRSVTIPIMDTELQELGNNGQGREKQEVESLLRQENEKNIPVVDE